MNIGILGAGNMAAVMADTIRSMQAGGEDVLLYAVSSRSREKAERFAISTGTRKAYGSYEGMLKDQNVDLVYIATPHSEHYKNMLLCLEYDKPILCEKAFTANADEAMRILMLSELKEIPVAEAIWTRYLPIREMISREIASGSIGKPSLLTADLSYNTYDMERIHRPDLCGGALLDVGVYALNFAEMVFGAPDRISSSAVMTKEGVDAVDSITLEWKDGRMASLSAGTRCISDRQGVVMGDEGFLTVDNINHPTVYRVYDLSRTEKKVIHAPEEISGYEYEIRSMQETVESMDLECPEMPHDETIHIMKEMDIIRSEIGYRFPFEE